MISCSVYSDVMTNNSDLMLNISSFCDYKELGTLQCVSQRWYYIAGDARLWQRLFEDHFPNTMLPKIECKETFRKRLKPICPDSLAGVQKVITVFMCQPKWNIKKQLVCEFPGDPFYSFTIQQGFVPKHGTEEGFKGAPEEVEYLQYEKAIIREGKEEFSEQDYTCTCCEKGEFLLCVNSCGVIPKQENSSVRSGIFKILGRGGYTPSPFGYNGVGHFNTPLKCVVKERIEINVGCGNTLGYCSEVNDWQSPFKLHCVLEGDVQVWEGLFPNGYEFKFVLIDANGKMIWEQFDDNRYFTVGDEGALQPHLYHAPIQF
jgi:hypothetical protein